MLKDRCHCKLNIRSIRQWNFCWSCKGDTKAKSTNEFKRAKGGEKPLVKACKVALTCKRLKLVAWVLK